MIASSSCGTRAAPTRPRSWQLHRSSKLRGGHAMQAEIYTVGAPDWRAYFDYSDTALKEVRRLNRIPIGRPYAGTYGIEIVTDPAELAIARDYIARKKKRR